MLKILFWSNEKWRDEAPNRLVRRREPAGGHFIPSQMAAHDANSGSGPTRNFRETIQARIKRDPTFREELFKEGMECLLAGDVDTGKAVLRDYINATVGFQELGGLTAKSPKSLMRMFSPNGNPQARNLFKIIGYLQKREGLHLKIHTVR